MAVADFGTIGFGGPDRDPADHDHVIASGESDVLLVAGTHFRDNTDTLTEVRWDPTGANDLLTEDVEGDFTGRAALSHQTNPSNQDGSTYTLRHDFSGTPTRSGGTGINLSGVDLVTPTSNAVVEGSETSGNMNVTVTTNADSNDIVVDATTKRSGVTSITIGASQTERSNFDCEDAGTTQAGFSTEVGGTNPTEMDWTFSGGNDQEWCSAGMLINAAAAAGATPKGAFGMPFARPFAGPFG